MANTIILKNGSGVPADGTLQAGEVAIDLVGKKLYSSTNGTDIFTIGGGSGDMKFATPSNNQRLINTVNTDLTPGDKKFSYRTFQVFHSGTVKIKYWMKATNTSMTHNSTISFITASVCTDYNYACAGAATDAYTSLNASYELSGQANDTWVEFEHNFEVMESGVIIVHHRVGSSGTNTLSIKDVSISYDITDTIPAKYGIVLTVNRH